MVKALGQQATDDSRVVRSRSLINSPVVLGSKQRKVFIVPGYFFPQEKYIGF